MTLMPRRSLELTRQESLALLRSATFGRIVFTLNALPAIRPVNHIVDGEAIIIRSHLGAAIVSHTAGGAIVAYEADEVDPETHLGWSVIVIGTAHVIREPAAVARYQQLLRPWVDRQMDYVISIHSKIVTGIRLLAAPLDGDCTDTPEQAPRTASGW